MSVEIDQAFVSAFINGGFGLPIAQENDGYDPTPGTAYAALTVFGNESRAATLSDSNGQTGLFQFMLYYPEGGGAIPAKQKADEIFAAFSVEGQMAYGETRVIVRSTQRTPRHDAPWYILRCRVFYEAHTTR